MHHKILLEPVALRPFDPDTDVPGLRRWLDSPQVARWWGSPAPESLAQRGKHEHAVITAGNRPLGYVCWQRPSPLELDVAGLQDLNGLVDIDILIGDPEFRGRGIGPKALALVADRLARQGVEVAGLGTAISNSRALRAFEKAGFRTYRDFEDLVFGPSRYMVLHLRGPSGLRTTTPPL